MWFRGTDSTGVRPVSLNSGSDAYNPARARGRALIAGYAGGERGARDAARRGAAVVVVDAFRASATISVLVACGARVVPVASISEAASMRADFRVGERGGAKVPGFDFGNSPTEILGARIPRGSMVALSTTNGTRVVEAAKDAPLILVGSFINAVAVAEELFEANTDVVVVGCGWRGHRASEDEAAAGAIIARLVEHGAEPDGRAKRAMSRYLDGDLGSLKRNSAARRLTRLGYERDLDFCLSEDKVPVVPRLINGAFARHYQVPRDFTSEAGN